MLNMTTPSVTAARKRTCFVISPIGKEGSEARKAADQVLKHLIKKALGDDFVIKRGDEESNPGSITSQIIESILEADLVVADLSGYNPNVYYEVAVAHGYERPTVHIQRSDEDPAFDLKDMRLVRYDTSDPDLLEKAQKTLTEFARFAMANPEKVLTPLSGAKRFVQISDSADPVAQSNAEVIDQLRALRTEVRRVLPRAASTTRPRNPDIPSLRKVIERAADRSALEESDFESIITPNTSDGFDKWARRILAQVTGEHSLGILDQILFDPEVLSQPEPDDPEE